MSEENPNVSLAEEITLTEDEFLTEETEQELSNGRGDDEDE